jgi:hypothetical protein
MRHVLVIAIVLLLAGSDQGVAGTRLLAPADGSPFDVGGASGQVLVADVNKDGHLDLLTRHQQARAIRIHLGDGRAGFKASTASVTLSFSPTDMRLGDVNGDEVLDLVVTATARDVVDVLLGTRGGVFRRARGAPFVASEHAYKYNKRSLHLADVNEDAHLDIITENRRGQYAFRVLLGDGQGRFAPGPVLTLKPAQEGYALAFADVDRDGDIDALTAVSSPDTGRLGVHLNNGRGAFTELAGSAVSLRPTYRIEATADIDSDRRPDLVLSDRSARVSILLNRGGGRFASAAGSPFDVSARPFKVAVADLNRDEHVDLVAATVDSVTVLLGDGHSFPRARRSSFRAGPGAYDLAIADLNEDERPDIVASSFESRAVTVLLGR